ncbi:MAG: 2-C-methyl-D-erythritol 2,4-cyclodiphosphate synthase [Candidatus Omnitrophica bacterium]|nr:2-C-methyl-D-erythritol 2,4-cyclodiphosphate synthase [Candidatus Omnitrophota bacterium]
MIRIGIGYDIHQLVKGRKLIIGGIEIPFEYGLLGHSDADVLLHAISDSLLGAASLGDIGDHFPDIDIKFKDANSIDLLKKTYDMVKKKGYKINNIDCIIYSQVVKIGPLKSKMKKLIAESLEIGPDLVNIKAKTMENLDAVGQGKAIAASSIALLEDKVE